MFTIIFWVGLVALIIGAIISYQIGRRRFYRRSITGMQLFKSYSNALITTLVEKILMIVATLLVITGLLFIFMAYYDNKKTIEYREKVKKEKAATDSLNKDFKRR